MKSMQPLPSLVKCVAIFVAVLLWAFAFGAIPSQASPPETLTREQVKQYCSVLKVLHSLKDDPFLLCIKKYGEKSFYTKPEIESLTIGTESPVTAAAKEPEEGRIKLKERPPEGWAVVRDAFKHLKIRQDYTDVLYEEDPSQAEQGKKFDDLSGATLSFARDLKADTDTWAAQAALILPMIWTGNLVPGLKPIAYGFVPSISLHRVTTDGDPADEVDSLIYRAGIYGRWLLPSERGGAHTALNLRGAFSYATDTRHELEIPAAEFDFEPQVFVSPEVSLGYVGEIFYDPKADYEDRKRIYLGYQLRAWLHGEYGRVNEAGASGSSIPDEEFFRAGPVVQLRIFAPHVLEGLTLSGEYHYTPAITGPSGNDTLFEASVQLAIYEDKEKHQISLKGTYTKGGLDLTKQDVRTFLIGLGVTF